LPACWYTSGSGSHEIDLSAGDLVLPTTDVSVEVLDPSGDPVVGGGVRLSAPTGVDVELFASAGSSSGYFNSLAVTDAAGVAAHRLLPAATADLSVSVDGYLPVDLQDVALVDGGTITVQLV
jgi:hypothetical protein